METDRVSEISYVTRSYIDRFIASDGENRRDAFFAFQKFLGVTEKRLEMTDDDLQHSLRRFGINDPATYADAWKRSSCNATRLADNIEKMMRLTLHDPHLLPLLEKDFGVRIIGRYPDELLKKQGEFAEAVDMPYGVVLGAKDDPVGSFYQTRWSLARMESFPRNRFAIRFLEYDTPEHALALLGEINVRYGVDNKMQFLVIDEHGLPDESFSELPRLLNFNSLTRNGGLQVLDAVTDPDATIVLDSCHANDHGGYGDKLEEALSTRTFYKRPYVSCRTILEPTVVNGAPVVLPVWYKPEKKKRE